MITNLRQVFEFPLCWPESRPRAAKRIAQPYGWNATLATGHKKIDVEMHRLGTRGYVVSMSPSHKYGSPDPGVAVWFVPKSVPLAAAKAELRVLACDKFIGAASNLYAIGLSLDRLRALERYGAYTTGQAQEGMRPALPPPAAEAGEEPWHVVLGVQPEWPLEAIEQIYRSRADKSHPDRGGSTEAMARLNAAMERARKELR